MLCLLDGCQYVHTLECSAFLSDSLRVRHLDRFLLIWGQACRQSLKWTLVRAVKAGLNLARVHAVHVGVLVRGG